MVFTNNVAYYLSPMSTFIWIRLIIGRISYWILNVFLFLLIYFSCLLRGEAKWEFQLGLLPMSISLSKDIFFYLSSINIQLLVLRMHVLNKPMSFSLSKYIFYNLVFYWYSTISSTHALLWMSIIHILRFVLLHLHK